MIYVKELLQLSPNTISTIGYTSLIIDIISVIGLLYCIYILKRNVWVHKILNQHITLVYNRLVYDVVNNINTPYDSEEMYNSIWGYSKILLCFWKHNPDKMYKNNDIRDYIKEII